MLFRHLIQEEAKKIVSWNYIMKDIKYKEIIGMFYEKYFQKTNQTEFITENVVKSNLYLKWKSFDNSVNSWIEKNI